jgi:anti-sigma factor RsiW
LFIHAYVDGELDLTSSIEVEQHFETCEGCRQTHEQLRTLRTMVQHGGLSYDAPQALRRRIDASTKTHDRSRLLAGTMWYSSPRILAYAASCAILVIIAWNLGRLSVGSRMDAVSDEVIASHVRSLLADHLTDVPSADQHTVKPWFNGRTTFSPLVKDLTAQGFALIGGRLEYIDDVRVAALVYQRRQHVINLFTWPSGEGSEHEPRTQAQKGYNLIEWKSAGMSYYAVSDLNAAELRDFVELVEH